MGPRGQEAAVQGGLKGSRHSLRPIREPPGAGGAGPLQGLQEVRQLGGQGEDWHGAEQGGHGIRVEQTLEVGPDVAAGRPALQKVGQHTTERGSKGVVRAVRPGRGRRSVLQPLLAQRYGPGREEQDHHAALLQDLEPLCVEPGQGPLRAQLTTTPQVHGHVQRQLAQRRRQGANEALEARVVGRVQQQSGAAPGSRCGRKQRRKEDVRWPEARPAGGGPPAGRWLTLTPRVDILLQEPQPPCSGRGAEATRELRCCFLSLNSPAPSSPTSGEWGTEMTHLSHGPF